MAGAEPTLEGLLPKQRQIVRTKSLVSGAQKQMLVPPQLLQQLQAERAATQQPTQAATATAKAVPAATPKPAHQNPVHHVHQERLPAPSDNGQMLAQQSAPRRPNIAPPNVLVVENYLSAAVCKQITDYIEYHHGKDPTIRHHPRRAYHAPIDNDMHKLLGQVFYEAFSFHIETFFNAEIEYWELPQPLRYAEGGKYDAHSDCEDWKLDEHGRGRWVKETDRDISVLIYLNDDYEGGALEFPDFNYVLRPKPGMLVAFPSNSCYRHGALPTISGRRYVLVSWSGVKGVPRIKAMHPRNVYMHDFRPPLNGGKPAQSAIVKRDISPSAAPTLDMVKIWDNFIDERTCRRICTHIEKMYERDSRMPNHSRTAYHAPSTPQMDQLTRTLFFRAFTEFVEPYFGVDIEYWELPQPLRYAKGGKYDPHSDCERMIYDENGKNGRWVKQQDRDMSVLLYLNDDFKGGTLTFPGLGLEIKPKPGMLVAFPSHSGYKHGANPTEEGHRYVLVTWAGVKGVPRLKEMHKRNIFMNEFWKE